MIVTGPYASLVNISYCNGLVPSAISQIHGDNELSDHIQPFAVDVIIQPLNLDGGFVEHDISLD